MGYLQDSARIATSVFAWLMRLICLSALAIVCYTVLRQYLYETPR